MLRAIDPYINIEIETELRITPDKLNNDLYINLKKKCEEKLLNRSYKEYGYITHIYELIKYQGFVKAEELHGVASFKVHVSCRVCAIYKGAIIICSIQKMTESLIFAKNGPITMVIVKENMDATKFIVDATTGTIKYKTKSGSLIELKNEMRINVTVLSRMYNVTNVFCYGYLNKVADRNEGDLFNKNVKELEDINE